MDLLPLVAGINATLHVLNSVPIEAELAARAVVGDDGRDVRLTLYSTSGAVDTVVLDSIRSTAVAGRLIHAPLAPPQPI